MYIKSFRSGLFHTFYRQLGCLSFNLRFWPKNKQLFLATALPQIGQQYDGDQRVEGEDVVKLRPGWKTSNCIYCNIPKMDAKILEGKISTGTYQNIDEIREIKYTKPQNYGKFITTKIYRFKVA